MQSQDRETGYHYLDRELKLVIEFSDEEVVSQGFPCLHDPDDSSIDLVLAILKDSLMCAHLFLLLLWWKGMSIRIPI